MFKNSLFPGNSAVDDGATPYVVGEGSTFDLKGFVEDAGNSNLIDTDPQLTSLEFTAPNFAPVDGSPLRGAGAAPAGFDAADYIGGVANAEGDWTLGWSTYAAN